MPRTPHDFGGPLQEEKIQFEDQYGTLPGEAGNMLYSDGYFYAQDQYGVFNLKDGLVNVSSNDTSADYLGSKLRAGDSSITFTEENDGYSEVLSIVASVGSIVSVDNISSATLLTTTSISPQDAFSGNSLSPTEDGDYLVFFEADMRMTNNNGIMAISVGLNSTSTEELGSERVYEGSNRGSAISIFRLNGLTTSDTIHGLFKKLAEPGTAQIRNRSLTIMRIA